MIRVAVLCHYPPCWFFQHEVEFDPGPIQGELDREAFSSVEGLLVQGLAKCPEIELHVISFSKGISRRQTVQLSERAELHLLPAPRFSGMPVAWFPRLIAARRLLADLQPDVVHGIRNLEGYGFIAAFSGFPSVVTPHEFLSGVPRPWHMEIAFALAQLAEMATYRKTRHIITITPHVRSHVEKRSAAAIHPIPNIIHPDFYAVRKAAEPAGVLFVGRVSPEKGLLDLLRAVRLTRAQGLQIPVTVVGGPSGVHGAGYMRECENFARSELDPGQVQFLGWQSSAQIAALHERIALFVMPSQAPYETMGLVIGEALAAGTPSVVYEFGPLPMLIRRGENGSVVPVGDIQGLAAEIRRIVSNPQLLKSMSVHARQGMGAFAQEAVVAAHRQVYEEIASRGKSSDS